MRRAFAEGSQDNVGVLAGGGAFFGFLAIFSALIPLVSLYGLVARLRSGRADPQSVTRGCADHQAGGGRAAAVGGLRQQRRPHHRSDHRGTRSVGSHDKGTT